MQKLPILRLACDDTLHAFPPNTPETEIERYMWRYENGQNLPDFALTPAYDEARAALAELAGCACDDQQDEEETIFPAKRKRHRTDSTRAVVRLPRQQAR